MSLFGRKNKEEKEEKKKMPSPAAGKNMKRRLIVACGSGVATSQTIASKIQSMLEKDGINYPVDAVDYKSIEQELPSSSIYVYVAQPDAEVLALAEKLSVKVYAGIPFLTGMGMDEIYQSLVKDIRG